MQKRVAAIPGEDAAPEAMQPSVELIERMGLPIQFVYPKVGAAGIQAHGSPFADEARAEIDATDATLFGATSGLSAGALFYLRWGKGTYANVRPTRFIPGFKSPLADPQGLDLVIVRENLEDTYVCTEGELSEPGIAERISPTSGKALGELGQGRFAIKAITEQGSRRVGRFAFELARRRKQQGGPGRLTCGTKHNMLNADGLFRDAVRALAAEYPEVELESLIVDDLAHRLVARGKSLDVIVLPNLYGDVLSDAAAALAGGLGLAASGCYGDDYAYFESAHGTAPDIAGKGIINPTATLLSAAMMLEYLGWAEAAARLRSAIEAVYADGRVLTPDQGGRATTVEFCGAIEERL